jgi:hypothetical protein
MLQGRSRQRGIVRDVSAVAQAWNYNDIADAQPFQTWFVLKLQQLTGLRQTAKWPTGWRTLTNPPEETQREPRIGLALPYINPDLAQVSNRCVDWTADRFAGYQKFNSPVLLPAGGVVVGSYRQSVAEPFRRNRSRCHSLLHQVVTH